MRDPAWLASHTQYGGVQNDPRKIRIGVQVLNRNSYYQESIGTKMIDLDLCLEEVA